MNEVIKRSWYQEPLVWMVIVIPLTAVVAGIITIIIAVKTDDGLVVDDYYTKGKEINLVVAREEAAFGYQLAASFNLDASSGQIITRLQANESLVWPERVELQLMHATRPGFDQTLMLVRSDSGEYRSPLPELVSGRWHVQLAADDWRLLGSMQQPETSILELQATKR